MKAPHTALVVDDSPFIRMSATKLLKELGLADVHSADNGRTGLEQFRLLHPDIVILDGVMPETDGLEVLKEIKKERPKTVVIVSSSLSVREKILEFKAAGADHYLLKPYPPERFKSLVQGALSVLEES